MSSQLCFTASQFTRPKRLGEQRSCQDEVVGSYTDDAGITHGYIRRMDGNIVAPIDVAGATTTELRSINDNEVIVGRYYDSAGHQYGFALLQPDTFILFNYPGASKTALNGVNDYTLMTGYYTDATTLVTHGVVARLR